MSALTRLCAFCRNTTVDPTHTACVHCGASLPGLPRRLVRGANPTDAPSAPREVPTPFAIRYLFGTGLFWLATGVVAWGVGLAMVLGARVWPSALVPLAWLLAYGYYLFMRLSELRAMRHGQAARGMVLFVAPSRQGWGNTQIRYTFFGPKQLEGETITSDPAARTLRPGDAIAIVHIPGATLPGVGALSAVWPPFREARWP